MFLRFIFSELWKSYLIEVVDEVGVHLHESKAAHQEVFLIKLLDHGWFRFIGR